MRVTYEDLLFSQKVEFDEQREENCIYIIIEKIVIDNKTATIYLPKNCSINIEYFIIAANKKWNLNEVKIEIGQTSADFKDLVIINKQLAFREIALMNI